MKRIILAAFLSFSVVMGFAQSKEEAAVLARVEAFNKAVFQTKDSAALQDLVCKDVTYGHSGGNIEDKGLMIHNAVANTAVYNNFTVEPILIRFPKKDVAVLRHILRANVVDKGAESVLSLGVLQTWVKDSDGKWRLVGRQAVKVPEKTK